MRETIRDAAASAYLATIKQTFGVQAAYRFQGLTAGQVTIWVLPRHNDKESLTDRFKGISQEEHWEFVIPRQTGYPPAEGPCMGDEIDFLSKTWTVFELSHDSLESKYTIHAKRTTAITGGFAHQ